MISATSYSETTFCSNHYSSEMGLSMIKFCYI